MYLFVGIKALHDKNTIARKPQERATLARVDKLNQGQWSYRNHGEAEYRAAVTRLLDVFKTCSIPAGEEGRIGT